MKSMASLALLLLVGQPPAGAAAAPADLYRDNCAACHGARLQGGQGPALVGNDDARFKDDAALFQLIRDGDPKGMPAWGGTIAEPDIHALVQFIKEQRVATSAEDVRLADRKRLSELRGTFKSEVEGFRLELVTEIGKPTGLAILPDGRVLVSQEDGALWAVRPNGTRKQVQNMPVCRPQDIFRRGLLAVALHPAYQSNHWIYVTCANTKKDGAGEEIADISLIRGRLNGSSWADSSVLLHVATETSVGAPIAFDDRGHVFTATAGAAGLGVGPESKIPGNEPLDVAVLLKTPPQDVRDPNGKILRFNDDGTVPSDNPFRDTPEAYPAVWALGIRNAGALAFDARTHRLWATDHGPRGGDKVNLIVGGHNYGWPVISYGTRYDGVSFTREDSHAGMDQPVVNWTPDIGVSAVAVYRGTLFPKWDGNLLVGSLATQQLVRVALEQDRVVVQERLIDHLGRIRAIAIGPGGEIYVALELGQQGALVRLRPWGTGPA